MSDDAIANYPLPQALTLTIIQQIAMHLFAACNGKIDDARYAASQTLAWYNPATVAELYLAAKIITFNLQAGEALASASDPALPLNRQMRLRSGALRLDREAGKAQRHLDKLREPVRAVAAKAPKAADAPLAPHATQPIKSQPQSQSQPQSEPRPQSTPVPPRAGQTAAPFADPKAMALYAKSHGITWTEGMSRETREQALATLQAKEAERFLAAVQAAVGSAASFKTEVLQTAAVGPLSALA